MVHWSKIMLKKKERKKERKKIESQAIYNGCKFSVVVLRMLAIAL